MVLGGPIRVVDINREIRVGPLGVQRRMQCNFCVGDVFDLANNVVRILYGTALPALRCAAHPWLRTPSACNTSPRKPPRTPTQRWSATRRAGVSYGSSSFCPGKNHKRPSGIPSRKVLSSIGEVPRVRFASYFCSMDLRVHGEKKSISRRATAAKGLLRAPCLDSNTLAAISEPNAEKNRFAER